MTKLSVAFRNLTNAPKVSVVTGAKHLNRIIARVSHKISLRSVKSARRWERCRLASAVRSQRCSRISAHGNVEGERGVITVVTMWLITQGHGTDVSRE